LKIAFVTFEKLKREMEDKFETCVNITHKILPYQVIWRCLCSIGMLESVSFHKLTIVTFVTQIMVFIESEL
jgi:hypothetical protein